MNPHCRIGKTVFKRAPNLAVLTTPPLALDEHRLALAHEYIDDIWNTLKPDGMAGIVIVGFNMKGEYMRATRIHSRSPVGPTLLPSFIAEILRCDKTRDIADEVINERMR